MELDFEIFAAVVILPFSATFARTWNFYFPTATERIVRRSARVHLDMACFAPFDRYKSSQSPSVEMGSHDPRQREGIKHTAMEAPKKQVGESFTSRRRRRPSFPGVVAVCFAYFS
jgi:hypothetical protein